MPDTGLQERIFLWVCSLVNHARGFPKDYASRVIAQQLIRCGTSVGANYVEAQGGSSKRDFVNFLRYALKSARESDYWLKLTEAVIPNINKKLTHPLRGELDELTRILVKIIVSTQGKRAN
ncbi:MAG TPA: four helix bundle protein [Candidatus Paceibacterota bacterium]